MRTNRWIVLFLAAALAGAAFVTAPAAGQNERNDRQAQAALQAAINKEVVDGDLEAAIAQYKEVVSKYAGNRAVVADAMLHMAEAYQKLGDTESRKIFEQVVRDFADQKQAADQARVRLEALQASPPAKPNPRLMWQWQGIPSGTGKPSPSPDDHYFTFCDTTGDAAVRDINTGAIRHLTNLDGSWSQYTGELLPSPDSRQIAYTLYIDKENDHKVELRVASVSDPTRMTVIQRTDQSDYFSPRAWTPDGKQLIVVRRLPDRTNQIGVVTLQDSAFRSIKSLDWRYPNLLSLSPDGRYIAYDAPANDVGSSRDIYVLAVDGSRETVVERNPANDAFPLWSPDGAYLVFLSDRTGTNGIWGVPIKDGRTSGDSELLKPDIGPVQLQGMTKSGRLYYFEPPNNPGNLFMTELNGVRPTKTPTPVTERLIDNNGGSTWSPDGQYLAYYSFRRVSADTQTGLLVVRTTKTGEERTIPLPPRVSQRFAAGPKWFPDKHSVLIEIGDAQGPAFGFYRLSLETGNTELLAHVPRQVYSYDLSPDGRTIYYVVFSSLTAFDIGSRRETELRNTGDHEIVSIALSPDGKQLATTLIGGIVQVMPAAGGQPRDIFRPMKDDSSTGSLRQALAWTPDQRYLLFVLGDNNIYAASTAGGEAEKIGISMGFMKNLAIHPDGKQLVFSTGSAKAAASNIWALEKFLPVGTQKAR